ncbi:MAG: TRAP transporter small permease [Desulfotignum sp.]|nr:TRAP transporter small permease [Desulfotignum sp.]
MRVFTQVLERIITLISGGLQGIVICLLMGLILVEVTSRYLLQTPLSVAEEYGGYMLVAITYIGLAYTWKHRTHVRVTFLIDKFPLRIRLGIRVITLCLALVFSGYMCVAAWELVQESFLFGDRSGSWLRTPLAWPQMTLIIGAAMLFLQLSLEVIQAITRFILVEEEV